MKACPYPRESCILELQSLLYGFRIIETVPQGHPPPQRIDAIGGGDGSAAAAAARVQG